MNEHIVYEYHSAKRSFLFVPLTLAPLALGVFFFFWLISLVLPVLRIELQYQYKSIMTHVFHVSNIQSLILPMFSFDIHTNTYDVNGIHIPSIFVDEPIIFNVDPNDVRAYQEALKKGIAHASGSSFPGTGGLGYYFAHSANPNLVRQYNAVFYLLGKVSVGDDVYVWHDGTKFHYVVTQKRVTDPKDVAFLNDTYTRETIVLQTCWPPGTTLQRLLVFAESR